jgi:hypothetical protein
MAFERTVTFERIVELGRTVAFEGSVVFGEALGFVVGRPAAS